MRQSAQSTQGPLTASALKHRATLQSGSIVTDSMGGRTEVWTAFATRIAASADPQPFIVNEKEASVLYFVRVRYRSDVILDGGQRCVLYLQGNNADPITLKILAAVNPGGTCKELHLHCGKATV